jgi:SAM-dependent methyltransferase
MPLETIHQGLTRGSEFSRISCNYNNLRTFQPAVLERTLASLRPLTTCATIVSAGVGTGRYLVPLLLRLTHARKLKPRVVGIDRELSMIEVFARSRSQLPLCDIFPVAGDTHYLPLRPRVAEAVLCFNAIHHFRLTEFLTETARILRPKGRLLVYTRTPEQNRRTVWGRLFPEFAERETRLRSARQLSASMTSSSPLRLVELSPVHSLEATSVTKLMHQAQARHYSTFQFFGPDELQRALRQFRRNLLSELGGRRQLTVAHDNMWLVAERRA